MTKETVLKVKSDTLNSYIPQGMILLRAVFLSLLAIDDGKTVSIYYGSDKDKKKELKKQLAPICLENNYDFVDNKSKLEFVLYFEESIVNLDLDSSDE